MPIRLKLIISFLILALMPALIITPFFYSKSEDALKNQFFHEEARFIETEASEIEVGLNIYLKETIFVSLSPPIQGIIRSEESGIDPLDNSSLLNWKSRLASIFTSMAKVDDTLLQVRYIDENGQELVRINSRNGIQEAVPEKQLQNKADRDYFIETMKLTKGEIHTSPMSLNVENGKIELPHTPTLRFATPIFDERDGSPEGIVILNIAAQNILNKISVTSNNSDLILTDQDGDFLFHPTIKKAFSHELGGGYNYFNEQPELIENTLRYDEKAHFDKEEKQFITWRKVFYNKSDKSRYWILYAIKEEADLLGSVIAVRNFLFLAWSVVAFFVFFGSLLMSNSITLPIKHLTKIITEISRGNLNVNIDDELLNSKNEIGLLARAFNRTLTALKMAIKKETKPQKSDNDLVESSSFEDTKDTGSGPQVFR